MKRNVGGGDTLSQYVNGSGQHPKIVNSEESMLYIYVNLNAQAL